MACAGRVPAFGNAAGVAGDTVSVDFTITTEAFAGLQFMFEYDASRLTFDGIDWTPANDEFGAGFPADLTNGDNKVFTSVGPYKILAWATGIGVGAVDLSAGVVMATLNFTINEDALPGDAYVKFAPLGEGVYQPNKIETGAYSMLMDEMTFVDGTVTVLPEGYSMTSHAPVVNTLKWEDGSFEWNDDFTAVILTSYTGTYDGGVLVIDMVDDNLEDEYPAVPVVDIAPMAFNANTKIDAFVLGEQVANVDQAAFYRCTATDYYVLNPDCVLGDGALGAAGTWTTSAKWNAGRGGTATGPYVTLVNAAPVTIHAAAGSTGEAYAKTVYPTTATYTEASFAWSAVTDLPSESTVIFNDTTCYVATGDTIAAPGVAVVDGETVVAWTDGTNTYAAGASMTITEDVVLEPVTITAPVTSTEADFKLAADEADLAMRFTATLSKADYATLASLGTVELGMLITPAAYVAKAGSFTKAALDTIGAANGAYVDIAIDGYYKETADDYILAGSLKGFSAKTLAKNPDFASVVYATVETAEGDVFTVYGDFNFDANQNVKTVAEAIVATNITNTQKGWLNTLIGKFGA